MKKRLPYLILIPSIFVTSLSPTLHKNIKEATSPAKLKTSVSKEYTTTKKIYLKAVDTYKHTHQDFLNAKDKYKKLSSAENEANVLERAKDHLKNSLETIIRHLEVLKNRVENIPGIDEDLKNNLIEEIDTDISYLQSKLDVIDDTSSLEEIKDFSKTVKEYWLKVRGKSKRVVGHILAARIKHFIDRLKTLSDELKEEVAKLEAVGVDTSEITVLLSDFDENITLAEEKYKDAVEIFQSISSVDDAHALFSKGHDFVKEGHSYLKQAHADLKEAVNKLKQLKSEEE